MKDRYTIERLNSQKQLLELKESWESLTERIPQCSYFLRWDWVSAWWDNLRNSSDLWLLTARDRSGELKGVAPLLCGPQKFGPLILRRIGFIGSGIAGPVHLDFLAGEEESKALAAAFLQYLNTHDEEWDILDLQACRADSYIKGQVAAAEGAWMVRTEEPCAYVSLPTSWETFQNTYMNRKLRKTIRYYERRLEKDFPGQVAFLQPENEAELQQAVDFLITNSRRLFSQMETVSCFENENYCVFFREMTRAAFRRCTLRFYLLKVGEQIVAVQYCFSAKGIFYGYQTTYDPDWAKYSPGQQLLAYVFQEAIGEKALEIDMSHGETDYKARWATASRINCRLLYVRNPRARLCLLGIRSFDGLIDVVRMVLPLDMRRRIGRYFRIGSLIN